MKNKIFNIVRSILNILVNTKLIIKSLKKSSDDTGDILIINIHGIGDVVMSTPLIDAVAGEFSDRKIDLLVQPLSSVLVEKNRSINKIYQFNEKKPFSSIRQIDKQYDIVIVLLGGIWGSIAAILLRYNRLTGMVKNSTLKITYGGNGLRKKEYVLDNKSNFVDNLFKIIYPVTGGKKFDKQYRINADLENVKNYTEDSENIAVIAPETNWKLKNINEKDINNISGILGEHGYNVYILGNNRPDISESNKYNDLRGMTKLNEAIKIISQSKLVVASDSAFMHIASAYKIPLFCIFGPTDPDKLAPITDCTYWHKKLFCAPCYDGISIPECVNKKHNFCMKLDDKEFNSSITEFIKKTAGK